MESPFQRQPYKEQFDFDSRLAEAINIKTRHPDRIPVIVERYPGATQEINDIDRNKYLLRGELTVAMFMKVLRERIKLNETATMYLFLPAVNNKTAIIPNTSDSIESLYQKYKDADGFLYLYYRGEAVFG